MLERELERKLKHAIVAQGGLALKFVSPGLAGVPDRLILLPNAKIAFTELKAPGQNLRPLQQKRKRQLEELGFAVFTIDSVAAMKEFLQEVLSK